jgi:hypothetical protein
MKGKGQKTGEEKVQICAVSSEVVTQRKCEA